MILRTYNQLQSSEIIPELIPAFLEISSDVIWSYDLQKCKCYRLTSKENEVRFGFPAQDEEDFWMRNVHKDDLERARSEFSKALADPSLDQFSQTYRFYTADRKVVLIHDKVKIIRSPEGNARLMVGVWRDITNEKEHQKFLEEALENQVKLNRELEIRQEKIRLTQEELKQSNAQLTVNYQQLSEREFIQNISQRLAKIGSWEYEYATNTFYWSDEMYNVFGVDKSINPNDVEYLTSLFEPASREVVVSLYNGIITKSNHDFDLIVQLTTPLGYKKWLRAAGYCPDSRRPDRMIGVVYDITYFKESEARLRLSEEKFSKAFNSSPDPMLIVRRSDGIIVNANNKTGPLLGYSVKDLVGRKLFKSGTFISHEDSLRILSNESTEEAEFECTLITHLGAPLHVIISRSTIYFEDIANYILVIKDITARKVAEEKLRLSEANLRATVNNTNIMVWSVDREMRFVMTNTPFRNYMRDTYGYDVLEGEYAIPDPERYQTRSIRDKWVEFYKRALSGETFNLSEERHGRQLSYSLTPVIENGKVLGVSVFAEDISERIQNQRELADAQRSLAEYKLIALRSVMNPHFIFNALNSIQYFITRNDRLNAISYLSTFSKLIRGILNNSKNKSVKLSSEIELLKHYIELEMMRFENKFKFVLDVDEEFDTENIEVQPLIIQPFVENAILHGLYNSPKEGILKISIKDDSFDGIVFIIEDNGIGREAAMALRKKVNPSHQSFGISLTEERLRLMNTNKDVSVEIEDLRDDSGPAGTRVKIWVKV